MQYDEFLATKRQIVDRVGFDVSESDLNPMLFPFQRAVVRWALHRGRAALFMDCGSGKSPVQLDWAEKVCQHTSGNVLILCPLAVAAQTEREGRKFGIAVTVCRSQADVQPGINITNYERLHLFDRMAFTGIVLDESSILKSYDGATRKAITDFASGIHYRLACTATPAPNDLIELTNHAEFLNINTGKEILAMYFTQDGNTTHQWRLKGHAKEDFWRWLASWSVAMRKPSDLGYSDEGFDLPELRISHTVVDAPPSVHTLFPMEALTMAERREARRESTGDRVAATAAMVNASDEQWVVWCDLNKESEALAKAIPDAVEVQGKDTAEHKQQAAVDFASGSKRVLVSKPSIFGFGLNWQHCRNVAFVGLSDSYEAFYQAVRRCWRYGQENPVQVHVIAAETEGAVVANIQRKERQAADMFDNLTRHMKDLSLGKAERNDMHYETKLTSGSGWRLYLGDSVELMDELETESVGLTVTSPPFPGMYAYTNSPRDMGNVKDISEMLDHFRFLVGPEKLLRVTMPGRTCALHLTQSVAFKQVDGFIGLRDFRGRIISLMEDAGWIYYGEVCIDKNPQVKAIRTKDRGLLFKTLAQDSAHMHMALADYLLQFRKPGENPRPIPSGLSVKYGNGTGWITQEEWIEWAAPVWYRADAGIPGGIRETDVLNVRQARETDDERHLAPLQLGVIERAVKLWSAPGDLVLDPFNGIGSTGFKALQLGREYVGFELKRSYWKSAQENLAAATAQQRMILV
jgi:DNA modification methylase